MSDQPDRRRIEQIFHAASELQGAARADFLDSSCGGDTTLRREVESLLKHFDNPTVDALRTPVWSGDVADLAENVGDTIDRYQLVDLIGEGGFGVVFKAHQVEPVQRDVALKVIKLGMDTRQVVARFNSERQSLALMDHPNVAHVLDAGATAQGRPYFVMEYVPGQPITTACEWRKLSLEERLNLFTQVCAAVQHAHHKGIIHRDLKPSNVLVVDLDGEPTVKVIDFGIAKAIEKSDSARSMLTERGMFIGTPEYMSPEQASGRSLDVDTRTDVYSLGVMLYELLSGTLPFPDLAKRTSSPAEIERIICSQVAPRPSSRVSHTSGVARARSPIIQSAPRSVQRDLDWIVLKAIEKDRARRYDTPAALADDIRRFLNHEPVTAGPPSATYRIQKFVRRNKGAVLAAAVILLLLIGGIVGTTSAMFRAQRAESEAQALAIQESELRKRAQQAEAETAAVNQFLITDMLSAVRPEQALGRTISLQEVVDAAAQKVGSAFPDQPAVEASVRDTLAGTYRRLARLEEAEQQQRASLELRRASLDANDPRIAQSANQLAIILRQQGRLDEAEPLYREALTALENAEGADAETRAGILANYATLLRERGDLDQALLASEESIEVHLKLFGESDHRTGIAVSRYSTVLSDLNRDEEALEQAQRAYEIFTQAFPPEHPAIATARNDLAMTLFEVGRYDESVEHMTAAAESFHKILGPKHPHYGICLLNVAKIQLGRGDTDSALTNIRASREITDAAFPPGHRFRLTSQILEGRILTRKAEYAEAEKVLLAMVSEADEHQTQEAIAREEIVMPLVELYEASARPEDAASWRAKLASRETAGP